MPGSPIRRARREAEKREAELRQSDPKRWAAEQMLRQQLQQAEQQQEAEHQQSTLAPLSSTADRVRVGATHELYRTVLDGAQDALTLLREGMAGTARGRDLRDLAVTAQALLRAAREMEKHAPPEEPPSLAELEAAEAEAERLLAERRGRG